MHSFLENREKLIEVRDLSKSFPGVKALSDVSFDLYKGELHCIVGENGAGKSTFIKILSGALIPDKGEIFIESNRFYFLTPHIAQIEGISTIYQENILVPQVTVAENIFLGRENTRKFGFISYKETYKKAMELMDSLNIKLRVDRFVEDLEPAEQQFVKILKSLVSRPKVLIMDEPTAMLDKEKTEILLNIIRNIKKEGIGIIYISHHLEEIIEVADKVTVLRDGVVVSRHDMEEDDITMDLLAREMVGRPVKIFFDRKKSKVEDVILEVNDLVVKGNSNRISFELYQGEILGIAGMVGSGRTEIVRAIFGADRREQGKILYKGRDITPQNPHESINAGFGMLTEDRHKYGLCLGRSVLENISIIGLDQFGQIFINLKNEYNLVKQFVKRLKIKTPSLNQEVRFLSGGNQQKVVLAKWLFKDVDILIFDEPTRGIDVNTKTEIYQLMSEFVSEGKSIIMVSSEMPELISMSDRVIVIKKGEISAVLKDKEISEENILLNSIGE